jgi:hypothetical protein
MAKDEDGRRKDEVKAVRLYSSFHLPPSSFAFFHGGVIIAAFNS